jgi:hypothetical protein
MTKGAAETVGAQQRSPSRGAAPLALVGFLFHAPGLKLLARARLSPLTVKLNVIAAALTLAAMAEAWLSGRSVLVGWLIGHFAWSATLAMLALRGQVTREAERPSAVNVDVRPERERLAEQERIKT